jgi:glycosyltransferase involved in cell wall biosynthesis
VRAAAREHEVVVLTRANNRAAIEAEHPVDRLRFVYLDLPRRLSFWKRGGRGLRLYYTLWQVLAAREGRRLHRREPFDVVHHLTFANVWLPALACLVPAAFVLGPVGGGPRVPLRLYRALGLRGALREAALVAARLASRFNPLARVSWSRARVILVQNEETRDALPRRVRRRTCVRPNASADLDARSAGETRNLVVCPGRLVAWKGVALAIDAVALLPDCELAIVGHGPDRARLVQRAERLGVAGRVGFVPRLAQDDLWRLIASSRAVVLPSLREDASFVAAEAQALGVPVVAFDRGGPAVLSRFEGARFELVPLTNPAESALALASALERAQRFRGADFGLDAVARDLDRVYRAAAANTCAVPAEAAA